MVRTRSIWLACITLGVLLVLLAAGRAGARLPDGQKALPGPGHAWVWQNPLPQGNSLVTVSAIGSHLVTAGGTQAVYSSADAGDTWRAFGVDTNQTIPSVILDPESDGQNGWMVVSNDQGGSFQSECWETRDYGATWTHLSDFAGNTPVDTLFALDAHTLYAGGDGGYVVVSTDAGATWDEISIPMDATYSSYVSGIAFMSATAAGGTVRASSTPRRTAARPGRGPRSSKKSCERLQPSHRRRGRHTAGGRRGRHQPVHHDG